MDWLQLVAYAVSFVLGIAASMLAWFLIQRIRPKYQWAEEISELTSRRKGLPFTGSR